MTFDAIQSKRDLPNDPKVLRSFSWELLLAFQELSEKYRVLQRQQFGRSSERLSAAQQQQLDAVQEQMDELLAQVAVSLGPRSEDEQQQDTVEITTHKRRRRKHHGRNAIPEEMITEQVVDVPEQERMCDCGCETIIIGHKSHIVVERIPAQYTATRYLRTVRVCPHCKLGVSMPEPVAASPIPKGLPGPALVAFVLLSKYAYHLPLYRIQRIIYHECGIWFTRSTLMGWVKAASGLLQRLHRLMLQAYRQSRTKFGDETPLRVRLGEVKGRCHQGYMWVGVGCDERLAVFWYNNNRSGKAALALLKGSSKGDYLMTDDLASYNAPVREYGLVQLLCMMHARRKFHDAYKAGYKAEFSRRALRKIGQVYRLERFATSKGFTVQQRGELRRTRTARVLAELKAMLEAPGFVLLPDRLIGKAINYSLKNWDKLTRFLESGDLPLDNGVTERTLRALTIGRNNWLFAGSRKGAEWMAALYSIIATCKLNGIDPHEYLAEVLMALSVRPPEADASDLTPLGWMAKKNGGELPPAAPLYPDQGR